MGLSGKRVTSPTVPMIPASRMGPTPKIWVRVVPEASTSASMRPSRTAQPQLSMAEKRRNPSPRAYPKSMRLDER